MADAEKSPTIGEMLAGARRWHDQPSPVWSHDEVRKIEAARARLREITPGSAPQELFDALRKLFPFEACLFDTLYASRPRDPISLSESVPDGFNAKRAKMIDYDPAIPVVLGTPAGVACVDVEVVPARALHEAPYNQEVYPGSGFGGVTGFMLSAENILLPTPTQRFDHRHVSLYLFRGAKAPVPTFRQCRMLEEIHEEASDAVARMQFPILSGHMLDLRFMEEDDDGYVLLHADGRIFQATLRAFALSLAYARPGRTVSVRQRANWLADFARFIGRMPGQSPMRKYVRRYDGRAILEVRTHRLPRSVCNLPEQLTVLRLSEVPLKPSPISEQGARLVATLSPRVREIVRLCVTTDLTAKEIAERLGTSARTVETQKQRAFSTLGVRSVAELRHKVTRP